MKKRYRNDVINYVKLLIHFYTLASSEFNNFFSLNGRVNPLLHRYLFLRRLQQTAFENIVTKEEIAGAI